MEINDTVRFDWFFGVTSKVAFLDDYIRGVSEGWTPDQWRAAIDQQIIKEQSE